MARKTEAPATAPRSAPHPATSSPPPPRRARRRRPYSCGESKKERSAGRPRHRHTRGRPRSRPLPRRGARPRSGAAGSRGYGSHRGPSVRRARPHDPEPSPGAAWRRSSSPAAGGARRHPGRCGACGRSCPPSARAVRSHRSRSANHRDARSRPGTRSRARPRSRLPLHGPAPPRRPVAGDRRCTGCACPETRSAGGRAGAASRSPEYS